ncbi:MAG: hypothetical protein ACOCQW_04300 [Halanaerobiaceae bacterium]
MIKDKIVIVLWVINGLLLTAAGLYRYLMSCIYNLPEGNIEWTFLSMGLLFFVIGGMYYHEKI